MAHMSRAAAFGLLFGLVAAGCSSAVEDAAPAPTTTLPPSTTTTSELEVVTTIRRVPAEELGSEGSITIGEVQYDFAFECFAAGAGDILALGVGQEPDTQAVTQAIVQMFFGQPYVSVLIGQERSLELALDAPAELFLQEGTIRGSALRFVDADVEAGVGEPLGLGEVTVACDGFAPGLPDEYSVSNEET